MGDRSILSVDGSMTCHVERESSIPDRTLRLEFEQETMDLRRKARLQQEIEQYCLTGLSSVTYQELRDIIFNDGASTETMVSNTKLAKDSTQD